MPPEPQCPAVSSLPQMHTAPAPSNQAPPQIRTGAPVLFQQTLTPRHTLSSEPHPPIIKHRVLFCVLSTLPQAFVRMTTAPLGLTWCSATPVFLRTFPFLGSPPLALILTRGGPTPAWCQTVHSFSAPTGTPNLTGRARSTCPAPPPPGRPLAWACPHPQGCSPQRLIQQTVWRVHST